jgi:hypothetical protein
MGGHKSNKHDEIWAKNAFGEWQQFHGYETNMSIANLLEKEESVKGLVDMICLFVLQVAKKDDNMYLMTKYFFLILLFFSNFFVSFLSQISCISVCCLCFILSSNFFIYFSIHGNI